MKIWRILILAIKKLRIFSGIIKKMSNPAKFSKKIQHSREKRFAYSEADIVRNEAKLNHHLEERRKERQHNQMIATGIPIEEKPEDEKRIEPRPIRFERQYYTKMNLVVNNLPNEYDIDKLCKTFEQLGSVMFVSKIQNTDGTTYNAKIVPNEWTLPISAIQQEIFDKGFSEYVLRTGEVCTITKDRKQPFSEYGDAHEYEDYDEEDDEV